MTDRANRVGRTLHHDHTPVTRGLVVPDLAQSYGDRNRGIAEYMGDQSAAAVLQMKLPRVSPIYKCFQMGSRLQKLAWIVPNLQPPPEKNNCLHRFITGGFGQLVPTAVMAHCNSHFYTSVHS